MLKQTLLMQENVTTLICIHNAIVHRQQKTFLIALVSSIVLYTFFYKNQ